MQVPTWMPHADDGLTALMVVARGNTGVARALLDAGADVNAKTQQGVTPLMVAVAMGSAEIVQTLLDAGADVDAKADSGVTAPDINGKKRLHRNRRVTQERGSDRNRAESATRNPISERIICHKHGGGDCRGPNQLSGHRGRRQLRQESS